MERIFRRGSNGHTYVRRAIRTTPRIMDVLNNQRQDSSGCVFTFFILVFVVLANLVPAQTDNQSLVVSSPYYLQVYPGTNPTEEASVGLKSLYFALMMSFGGDFRSSGAIPGVQVALDQINSNPTLLPGYQLHYTLTDSQVCPALTTWIISCICTRKFI